MPETQLEREIGAWRARMIAALPEREETVRELESHLRDHLEALCRAGVAPGEAFDAAVKQLGDTRAVAHEFQRMRSRWFGGVHSRENKVLAYAAGVLGVSGCALYLSLSIWALARLLSGKQITPSLERTVVSVGLALGLAAVCAVAMRASGRFLEKPNTADARSIVSFSLLVVWILLGQVIGQLGYSYAFNVTVVSVIFGLLIALRHAWIRHVARLEGRETLSRNGMGADLI